MRFDWPMRFGDGSNENLLVAWAHPEDLADFLVDLDGGRVVSLFAPEQDVRQVFSLVAGQSDCFMELETRAGIEPATFAL